MRELRQRETQRLKNQNVLEGVGQVLLAAQDVGDLQIGIVGAGRHVIRRNAAGAQQREVFDIGGGFGDAFRRPDRRRRRRGRVARDAVPQNKRLARRGAAVAFLRRKLAHPGVEQPRPFRARGLSSVQQPATAGVKSRYASPFARISSAIRWCSSTRSDWRYSSSHAEIQPTQAVENRIERDLGVALDVGVVDAQDHGPAGAPGEKPVEDEGPGAADVQISGGRRSKANSRHGYL